MKQSDRIIVGRYEYLDDLLKAVKALRAANKDFRVHSPIPNHEIDHALFGDRVSPVRNFTLLGGITGCLGAFLMTIWMASDYPMRTSAKPIISIPPFVVIAFECTILLGALFTFFSCFHFCRIPAVFSMRGYQRYFSGDEFGIVLTAGEKETSKWQNVLEQSGAKRVEVLHD